MKRGLEPRSRLRRLVKLRPKLGWLRSRPRGGAQRLLELDLRHGDFATDANQGRQCSDRRLSPEMAGFVDKVIFTDLFAARIFWLHMRLKRQASPGFEPQRPSSPQSLPRRHRFLQQWNPKRLGSSFDWEPIADSKSFAKRLRRDGARWRYSPAFDGGTRAALLEQAQTKSENAGLVLTRTRDEAVRQIVLVNNALRTSLSAYNAAVAVVSAAKTTFDAALAAYRSGVGSITDATMANPTPASKERVNRGIQHSASAAATLALSTGSLGAPLQ